MVVATAFVSRSIPRARAAIDFLFRLVLFTVKIAEQLLYIFSVQIFSVIKITIMRGFVNVVKIVNRLAS